MDILSKQIQDATTSHGYIFESKSLAYGRDRAADFIGKILDSDKDLRVLDRDLIKIRAEAKTIKIDSIREMIIFFQTKPFYGRYKVALIEDGARLRKESSNAMLRILEDLPSYGKIIILVRNAFELLPTIRSRCQIIRFESKTDYNIDRHLVEGLVESFLNRDLSLIIKNKDQLETMKDYGEEFFAIAIDYLVKLRIEENSYNKIIIEKSIDRAVEISANLKNNVNFLLSIEYFALGFIE